MNRKVRSILLASVCLTGVSVSAEEQHPILDVLRYTTIKGYVDASIWWGPLARARVIHSAPPAPPQLTRQPDLTKAPDLSAAATRYSIGDPSPEEQLYLELVNRARANPGAEGELFRDTTDPQVVSSYTFYHVDLDLMVEQFNLIPIAPPLAMNSKLITAARRHTQDMFDNVFQDHEGTDGTHVDGRVNPTGYNWISLGENIYSYADSVFHGHAGFEVDWGLGLGGMQTPPGHRNSIHNPDFREVGIGVLLGTNASGQDEVGPQLVTEVFGTQSGPKPFVTGVAYFDLNGNNFYDIGEGIGGLTVNVSGATQEGETALSGGYSVPVNGNGTVSVTFSGPNLSPTSQSATVSSGQNVKVDFTPEFVPTVISGPNQPGIGIPNEYSLAPMPGASLYEWRSFEIGTPVLEGAETSTGVDVVSSAGYSVFDTSVKLSGSTSFHLAHPQPVRQSVTLHDEFLVNGNTTLEFYSRLGWASTEQIASVELSADGGVSWEKVYSQAGTDSSGQGTFSLKTVPLGAFDGKAVNLRFTYDATGGYYDQTQSGVGWYFDDILVRNADVLGESTVAQSAAASFEFEPAAASEFGLQARARTGHYFLPWGPVKFVQAAAAPARVRVTSALSPSRTQMILEFELETGEAPAGFTVQSKSTVNGTWGTDSAVPESLGNNRYRATVGLPPGTKTRFVRILVNPI